MGLKNELITVLAQRQTIVGLVIKNLKAKYVESRLGIFWAIINPLLMMFAIMLVFTQIMKTEIKLFPLFVLSALLPWFFFINSVSEATVSMKKNADLLSQFIINRKIIPISVVLSNFINFIFGLILVFPFFVISNFEITRYILLLPLIMLFHLVFTLGISLLVSIGNVYFKDLEQMLGVGIMFLFWITPIFYAPESIPANYRAIIFANPATCYVVIYRNLLYQGTAGNLNLWFLAAGFSLAAIAIGYILFVKKESNILKFI